MAFKLTWLAETLLDAGVKVAEDPGWQTHGRREMGTVRGVMCHHTAGGLSGNFPSHRVVRVGRSDLPGPLSQLGLGRDGTFYVIAAGVANHAGRGEWKGVTTGNSSFIGIEAENTGLSNDFPWPDVQMDAYARGCAAILSHIGAPVSMCCGHKEWTKRKIDPTFDMNKGNHDDMDIFRARVQGFMDGTGVPRPRTPAEDNTGRPTLRRPASGDLVKEIQAKVGVDTDGDFGPKTEAAMRAFQRKHGLVPDGIVGPKTWEALSSV
ncbi:peptidoglycan recognition protein family protein [Parasedimentitalea psychrophila]|uniref:N-acetylmuramoyl-L-alanine amidase n=1 Tax=Parasedimentitalea psychrophila TaxID=2997337 RepID=A0A9Y2KYA3_9RHOB|nr:N-acetylmuramoyl-L-alanine amidase [Parasedimentitalea psychrophila]WIY24520.1 N-acetylmuramoyl-L-alanine amidase [Parasedimentitalea psychrophila]